MTAVLPHTVKVHDVVDGPLLGDARTLYHSCFADLDTLAVQRHLMYRDEFDGVMRDSRVQKYLAFDGGLVGLATYTNQLESMPLISWRYFQRRWPHHYAQRRIWYCGFVAVADHAPGAFTALVEAMWQVAYDQRGIICLDMCRHNDQVRRLSRVIPLMLHRLSEDVRTERMDEQSYWLYEFGAAK